MAAEENIEGNASTANQTRLTISATKTASISPSHPHPQPHQQKTANMPGLNSDDASNEERLKSALWYSVGKTVDDVLLGEEANAAPHFIGGLMELVAAKISAVAGDMEAFAQHADRSTINSKDVVLLARNNEALRNILEDKAAVVRQKAK